MKDVPKYQITGRANIEINLMDCMEALKEYPDNYFDLAIVDPPYGIGADNMQMGSHPNRNGKNEYPSESTAVKLKKKNRLNQGSGKLKDRLLNNSDCSWDMEVPSPEYFKQLFRVSKNQIIWGGNYFDLRPTRGIVCWDKMQPWDNFSQFEIAWTSFDKPAKMFRYSNTGGANAEKKIHPTQKPVKLYEWLLDTFAKKGDKILDTHLGSGSIAIACHNRKFDLVATEINADYFNSALSRIEYHSRQLIMF